jgi:hypothetical protein
VGQLIPLHAHGCIASFHLERNSPDVGWVHRNGYGILAADFALSP